MMRILVMLFIVPVLIPVLPVRADDADLAKKLSNPLASLISVPFQLNYDTGFGTPDGKRTTLNIQPTIPFSLTPETNVIVRTILPYKWQTDVGEVGSESGWGDTTMEFWVGPAAPLKGVTWGIGPAFNLPTSSDMNFGVGDWGGGFSAVVLAQPGPWTVGGLGNHIWSFNGDSIDTTYIQPFLSYTTAKHWTFTLNSESTYDWNAEEWTIPFNLMVSKLVSISEQRVQFQAGIRYYADSPSSGPEDWGARLTVTFVFPK